MSMPNNTPSPARPDTRAAFEAWAKTHGVYINDGDDAAKAAKLIALSAYLAGRAAALEEAAQIADAVAELWARFDASAGSAAIQAASAIRDRAGLPHPTYTAKGALHWDDAEAIRERAKHG